MIKAESTFGECSKCGEKGTIYVISGQCVVCMQEHINEGQAEELHLAQGEEQE